MSRLRLESDGDVDMSAPQPVYEFITPPTMTEWEQASLIKWRRARWQYEERIKERCAWTGEKYENVVAGVRSTIKPELLEFLAEYEFAKDKSDITDEEILVKVRGLCEATSYEHMANTSALFDKQLKMDMSVKDVRSRVSRYFMRFNQLIEDNGLIEILGRQRVAAAGVEQRTKKRTKVLVDNLAPPMLKEEIQALVEYKYKHVREDEQQLYKLVLERAELQQLFYNRFRAESSSATVKGSARKLSDEPSGIRKKAAATASGASDRTAAAGPTRGGHSEPRRARISAPREGCLHCKGEHWVRDCPVATTREKADAIAAHKSTGWRVKRAAVTVGDIVDVPVRPASVKTQEDDYTVLVNGAVEVSLCPDTGADCCIIPENVVDKLMQQSRPVRMTPMQHPAIVRVAGGQQLQCSKKAKVDLQIRTSAGPVNLYGVECLVMAGEEDQILLGKDVMKRLGIDVKRALETLANSSIELHHDDLPDEPTLGEDSDSASSTSVEIERMCSDIRAAAGGKASAPFADELVEMLNEYQDLWRTTVGHDEPALVEPLMVTLKDGAEPIRCKPRRYPPAQLKFLSEHVALLEKFGFVVKNNLSKWASNAVPVRKSDSPSDFRVTNDYTRVNERTVPIAGTMPLLEVMLQHVVGAKFFAKFDLFRGFWQILLDPRCLELFSFMTHDGVYTPLRVPQGATDSALHFQNQMTTVFQSLLYKGALIWIDDVIVYGQTESDFLANVRAFNKITAKHRLKLNAKKSVPLCHEVTWCGRIIDGSGVRQDPARLSALVSLPVPSTAADLQRFLCACNWVRESVVDFARVFEPLQAKLNAALTNRSKTRRSAIAVALE